MIDIKNLDLENDIIDLTERNNSANFVGGKYTLFPKDLITILTTCMERAGLSTMFSSGVLCRIMTTDKNGWQKGRLKVIIQFVPDEEPKTVTGILDELRQ